MIASAWERKSIAHVGPPRHGAGSMPCFLKISQPAFPRFTGDNGRHNAELPTPVAEIARARGVSMAQIAIA